MVGACCIHSTLTAQYSNLEFVENRGQWERQVKYKGVMTNGAFFLTEKGFTVVLHNNDDLAAMAAYFHHESDNKQVALKSNVTSPPASESGILHSHAYNVKFFNA